MNAELTIRLPVEEVEFLRAYAEQHGTTVANLVAHYARGLRGASERAPHPANLQFTGSIPPEVDVREAYVEHMMRKHS